jgi:hypothetical protein
MVSVPRSVEPAPGRSASRRVVVDARQVDLEGRPQPELAVHPDAPAALLHDAEDRREPEARALPLLLRREERLEDPRERRLVDAAAGVGDREHHVGARRHAVVHRRVLLVEHDVGRLDGELAAHGHRVARVDGEVHEHLLDRAGVGAHVPERRTGDHREVDVLPEQAPQHGVDARQHVVQVEHPRRDTCLRLNIEQLSREVRRPLAGATDLLDVAAHGVPGLRSASISPSSRGPPRGGC